MSPKPHMAFGAQQLRTSSPMPGMGLPVMGTTRSPGRSVAANWVAGSPAGPGWAIKCTLAVARGMSCATPLASKAKTPSATTRYRSTCNCISLTVCLFGLVPVQVQACRWWVWWTLSSTGGTWSCRSCSCNRHSPDDRVVQLKLLLRSLWWKVHIARGQCPQGCKTCVPL